MHNLKYGELTVTHGSQKTAINASIPPWQQLSLYSTFKSLNSLNLWGLDLVIFT
jgi:hypothetical protein